MDRHEAMAVLGLSGDPTVEEIESRFRELAHDLHPDKGGDHEAMTKLARARDAVLDINSSTALVRLAGLLCRGAHHQARGRRKRGDGHAARLLSPPHPSDGC